MTFTEGLTVSFCLLGSYIVQFGWAPPLVPPVPTECSPCVCQAASCPLAAEPLPAAEPAKPVPATSSPVAAASLALGALAVGGIWATRPRRAPAPANEPALQRPRRLALRAVDARDL